LALFQRFIALPTAPRFLALGVLSSFITSTLSELAPLREGRLIVAALVIGELLGHPFELRRRVAFAREAVAAGRVPNAAPDPAIAVQPLTLRFSNRALESAYRARTFGENYPIFAAFACGSILLCAVAAVALPGWRGVSSAGTMVFWVSFGIRASFHRVTDQAWAASCFAWAWCALWTLVRISIWALHRRYVLVEGMTSREWLCGPVPMNLLFALFQNFIALPAVPRFLTLAARSIPHFIFTTPLSELGQPVEGTLILAAHLLGEVRH
jgi:hypothetical protein